MNLERLTVRSKEAMNRAQTLARDLGHQQIEAEHVLLALFEDPDGMATALVKKIGVDVGRLARELESQVKEHPQVSGGGAGSLYVGDSFRKLFERAEKQAAKLQDEYISAEHFLLGATEIGGKTSELLTASASRRSRS
jgi:ATP-dependent Clp protease ATP-binding subunit ClpB